MLVTNTKFTLHNLSHKNIKIRSSCNLSLTICDLDLWTKIFRRIGLVLHVSGNKRRVLTELGVDTTDGRKLGHVDLEPTIWVQTTVLFYSKRAKMLKSNNVNS